jgi:hypothetical protein
MRLRFHPSLSSLGAGLAGILTLLLFGCGGNVMAPDAIVEDPSADAFLTRVAKECGDKSVGNNQLDWLINESDDAYFVDATSKLYFGTVSPEQYRSDINGFYPTGANDAALDCILSLKDGGE